MKTCEKDFEKEFEKQAPMFKCKYVKIPDIKGINASNRHLIKQDKRPFDGVFCTPSGNFCAEFKYNKGILKLHQKKHGEEISEINGKFVVIRKTFNRAETRYFVETVLGDILLETKDMTELFKYFLTCNSGN